MDDTFLAKIFRIVKTGRLLLTSLFIPTTESLAAGRKGVNGAFVNSLFIFDDGDDRAAHVRPIQGLECRVKKTVRSGRDAF